MLAVKEDDVREHGARVQSQQLCPKSVPALVDRAPGHKNTVAAVTFAHPLGLHKVTSGPSSIKCEADSNTKK